MNMKTVSLRASLPSAIVLVLLAVVSTSAQTVAGIPPVPSLASQAAPLADVRAGESVVPAAPVAAGSDRSGQAAQQTSGPMTVTSVRNAFVITPEVRFGTVNHRTGTFVGMTGGAVMDGRLFVGAGGYWLANHYPGFEMGYFGALVGWYLKGEGPFDLGIRGLIGGGSSTMTFNGAVPLSYHHGQQGYYGYYYVGSDFFITEPEADLCVRFSRSVWLNAGVAYRLIAGANGMNHDLQGVTGTVSVTFGGR